MEDVGGCGVIEERDMEDGGVAEWTCWPDVKPGEEADVVVCVVAGESGGGCGDGVEADDAGVCGCGGEHGQLPEVARVRGRRGLWRFE